MHAAVTPAETIYIRGRPTCGTRKDTRAAESCISRQRGKDVGIDQR
jgi:hypothetical protein